MKKSLILVGGGGHCRSCIDVIDADGGFTIEGVIDVPAMVGKSVLEYKIIGSDEDLPRLVKSDVYFLVTVGHVSNSKPRMNVFEKLRALNARLATVVSSHAKVSRYAQVGEGTIIMHKAVVNSSAKVGMNNIINTGSIIEHDTVIGDHSHISTGAIINGGCVFGDRVFVGSGAVVKEKIRFVENTSIGAGTVVIEEIKEAGMYVGNPARRLQ